MLLKLFLIFAFTVCGLAVEGRDISAEMESLRAKYKLPACAAAVVENGQITAIGASGLRRVDQNVHVTIGDIWNIGSCTKSMTATLVGVFVDAGKLQWDISVPDLFPGVQCHDDWQQVTLWHLVTHRSGIGNIWFPEAGRSVTSISPRQQRENLARSLLSRAPSERPGKSAYSNAGYALLGAILERITGENYEDLLRTYIFKPLALQSAGFGPPATPGTIDQPWGHRRQSDRLFPVDPALPSRFPAMFAPAGCVHMSLEDFARYAAWVSTGKPRLLKPETFARLKTPPEGNGFAGGVWKSEFPGIGGEAVCHTGHLGGFFAIFYAGRDRACVGVFNTEGGGWEWLGDEVISATLKAAQ